MTINLEVPPDLEKHLVAKAELLQMTVEAYLLTVLERSVPKIVPAPLAGESDEDFMAAMMSLSKTKTPASLADETWDRAAIYGEHA